MDTNFHPEAHLAEVAKRLTREFAGSIPEDDVVRMIDEAAAQWREAPVTAFVPLLAERQTRQRLRQLSRADIAG